MLFQHTWKYVLDGKKTQTRRPVQSSDAAVLDETNTITQVTRTGDFGPPKVLFEVGESYSVQPSVAKKTVGKIKVVAIRREHLQDISESDALQEAPVDSSEGDVAASQLALKTFKETWDNKYSNPGQCWDDNPEVWVVEFQLPFQ